MAGMAANKLMGLIRDKGNVNGLENPRKEVVNPMGQRGKSGSQQAYRHGRKRKNINRSPMG